MYKITLPNPSIGPWRLWCDYSREKYEDVPRTCIGVFLRSVNILEMYDVPLVICVQLGSLLSSYFHLRVRDGILE